MKRKDLKINTAGLYRCCVMSACDWVEDLPDGEAQDGETITCRYEREPAAQMVVHEGEILWRDPDYPPIR